MLFQSFWRMSGVEWRHFSGGAIFSEPAQAFVPLASSSFPDCLVLFPRRHTPSRHRQRQRQHVLPLLLLLLPPPLFLLLFSQLSLEFPFLLPPSAWLSFVVREYGTHALAYVLNSPPSPPTRPPFFLPLLRVHCACSASTRRVLCSTPLSVSVAAGERVAIASRHYSLIRSLRIVRSLTRFWFCPASVSSSLASHLSSHHHHHVLRRQVRARQRHQLRGVPQGPGRGIHAAQGRHHLHARHGGQFSYRKYCMSSTIDPCCCIFSAVLLYRQ